jgi:glutamate N-acetyltransferase/amino-acid N-acetyltransferase
MRLSRRAHRVRVAGFQLAGVRAGLKVRGRDVALIVADPPAIAAGVFTTNRAPGAPVLIARRRIARGRVRAVLINAGQANAATGATGLATARAATALVARRLGAQADDVLPCATGRIGVQVPRLRLLRGVEAAVAQLSPDGFPKAAEAITTTDAFLKTAVRRLRLGGRDITIAVLGKGGGMIAPGMATLLVFALTDARLSRRAADQALRAAVAPTLNAISVDGDMSTSDTTLLLASGAAGNRTVTSGTAAYRRFTAALTNALEEIGRLVVLDGEGSTRAVEVVVRGARSAPDAARVARAVGESTLCKAAFHGGDPNWGRFVCAAGAAGVWLDQARVDVTIAGVRVSRRGRPIPGTLGRARARMRRREFRLELDLHLGRGTARLLASDLTPAYVHFNSAYTT